jgi:hypothetical protein
MKNLLNIVFYGVLSKIVNFKFNPLREGYRRALVIPEFSPLQFAITLSNRVIPEFSERKYPESLPPQFARWEIPDK